MSLADNPAKCRDYRSVTSGARCDFVKTTDDCGIDEGFVNYVEVVFCSFPNLPLGVVVLFFWWLFLFIALAVTADDFFCSSLAVMSKVMKLSHNIAGVTLLAFGNGAPDIFSAIAAIGNAKNGDAGFAIGALVGAGVFVTTVVPGAIVLVKPFHAMSRPFLRDIIFYIAAVFFTFFVLYDRKITTTEAVGFILMYVVYVIVVVVGRYIRQRSLQKERNIAKKMEEEQKILEEEEGLIPTPFRRTPRPAAEDAADRDSEATPLLPVPEVEEERGTLGEFWGAINPLDKEVMSDGRIYAKVYEVVKSPIVLALRLTIPVVDESADNAGWCRMLAVLHCITAPLFCAFATNGALKTLGSVFPVYGLVLIIGVVAAIAVFMTSQPDTPPVYHKALSFVGFVVSVIWIYSIANEIVNILQMFGVVLNISNAILGLTLLAWGNSIGDLVADTAMARQGFPRMGISACFGGPLFNLLLGIGIPFTLGCIKQGGQFSLQFDLQEAVLLGALAFSLVFSLVALVAQWFHLRRWYGVALIVIYGVFLLLALLVETKVIKDPGFTH